MLTARERFVIPPFEGPVVDSTGGGDAFWGAYLLAYLRTGDPEYAGHFGAATALLMIGKTGGAWAGRMPTREMVDECMQRPAGAMVAAVKPGQTT